MTSLRITTPDDWHLHVRDEEMLHAVIPFTVHQFDRAIIMPNLAQPIVSTRQAVDYRSRILEAMPKGARFSPLMTAYLVEGMDIGDLSRGYADGVFTAAKLYPATATTNSHFGVRNIEAIYPILTQMEKMGMPLLIHGEVADLDVDVFDLERVFIDRHLLPILNAFPGLKVVLEHVTTAYGCDVVRQTIGDRLAATITAHHLVLNRNALFQGGINPHAYCLPTLKRESDRLSLRAAATGGSNKFFLGTDSAPHNVSSKECPHGCAGIFSAPCALSTYLEVFEEEDALDRFEQFASFNGPDFYGQPRNKTTLLLSRAPNEIAPEISVGDNKVKCFRGGETINWNYSKLS